MFAFVLRPERFDPLRFSMSARVHTLLAKNANEQLLSRKVNIYIYLSPIPEGVLYANEIHTCRGV